MTKCVLCFAPGNIQAVLSAANHLQILAVIEACAKFLFSEIDLENCVDIATISETYSLLPLRKYAYCFMARSLDKLACLREFQRLSAAQLEHLLHGAFPVECSEADVLQAVTTWIHYDRASRGQYVQRLLGLVHFNRVPLDDLLNVLNTNTSELKDSCPEYSDYIQRILAKQDCWDMFRDTETVDAGLINLRGLEKALVNIGGFQCSKGVTNSLTYLHVSSRTWKHLTDIPHVNQSNFGVAILNNEIYVIGGIFSQYSLQETMHPFGFKYTPLTDSWTTIAPMLQERCGFYLGAVDGQLYAVGGTGDQDHPAEEGQSERFDPRSNTWSHITALPAGHRQFAGAVIGKNIYIAGGLDWDLVSESLWCYNVSTDIWTQKCDLLTPRADHAVVSHNKELYLAGGWNEDPNTNTRTIINSLDVYSEETDQWQTVSHLPNPRYLSSLVYSNSVLYFIGGRCSISGFYGSSSRIDMYRLEDKEWQQTDDYPIEVWEHLSCELYIPVCREDRVFRRLSDTDSSC